MALEKVFGGGDTTWCLRCILASAKATFQSHIINGMQSKRTHYWRKTRAPESFLAIFDHSSHRNTIRRSCRSTPRFHASNGQLLIGARQPTCTWGRAITKQTKRNSPIIARSWRSMRSGKIRRAIQAPSTTVLDIKNIYKGPLFLVLAWLKTFEGPACRPVKKKKHMDWARCKRKILNALSSLCTQVANTIEIRNATLTTHKRVWKRRGATTAFDWGKWVTNTRVHAKHRDITSQMQSKTHKSIKITEKL